MTDNQIRNELVNMDKESWATYKYFCKLKGYKEKDYNKDYVLDEYKKLILEGK